MKRFITLFRRHPYLSIAFLAAMTLTGFFAVRTVSQTMYWADPAHREVTPSAWMTPKYVAHSWHVDPKDFGQAIGITNRPDRRTTLEDIARERGVPVEQVLSEAEAFLATAAAQKDR